MGEMHLEVLPQGDVAAPVPQFGGEHLSHVGHAVQVAHVGDKHLKYDT